MKIRVCFKVLPDYDKVPKKDWDRPEKLDFEYVKNIFGVFDEGALESALYLKDEMNGAGEECFAEAVTYGAPDEIFVSTLYAVGFDRVVEIHGKSSDFSPEDTAEALAEYFNNRGQESGARMAEIILLGKMTGPNDSGLVPYFLAKKLGCPVLNKLTALKYEEGRACFHKKGQAGPEKYFYAGPVVGIMEDAEKPYLRMYTLKTMMESRDKKPEIVEYKGKALKGGSYKIVALEKKQGNCEFLDLEAGDVWDYIKKEIAGVKSSLKDNDDILCDCPLREGNCRQDNNNIAYECYDENGGFRQENGAAGTIINSINREMSLQKTGTAGQDGIREVYSGYLGLKTKATLFGGKPAGETDKSAEEFYEKLLLQQKLYVKPDLVGQAEMQTDNLSEADVVAALGRGVGNKADYERIKAAFEGMGIPVGCTRLVAMNGYEDYSKVIGISGKSLKAKLCICVGVSGAGPFQQGLKNVNRVVAINNDRDALIFDRADVGIVGDAKKNFL